MTLGLRRFFPLWECRCSSELRLPVAYYFVRDPENGRLNCFAGRVRKTAQSRTFIDHSAVYGFVDGQPLTPQAGAYGAKAGNSRSNRLTRRLILDRIRKVPLIPAAAPAVAEGAAGGIVAAGGVAAASDSSASRPIDLL